MKEGKIKIPKMILFDYGQTLVNEKNLMGYEVPKQFFNMR